VDGVWDSHVTCGRWVDLWNEPRRRCVHSLCRRSAVTTSTKRPFSAHRNRCRLGGTYGGVRRRPRGVRTLSLTGRARSSHRALSGIGPPAPVRRVVGHCGTKAMGLESNGTARHLATQRRGYGPRRCGLPVLELVSQTCDETAPKGFPCLWRSGRRRRPWLRGRRCPVRGSATGRRCRRHGAPRPPCGWR
jgi:hypothetical protein